MRFRIDQQGPPVTARHTSRRAAAPLAAAAALCAAVAGYAAGGGGSIAAAAGEGAGRTVEVPVPAGDVTPGTRVGDVTFRTAVLPAGLVPPDAVRDLAAVSSDSVAATGLAGGAPVPRGSLVAAAAVNPVVSRIPAGMRAMTVRVDATTAVEGWAGSGAVVDVLLVTDQATSVVAERVKILSAERSVSPVEGGAAPSVPSTVTLLVTQEQCLAINTAVPHGRLAFALRSGEDDDSWRSTVFTATGLKAGRGSAPDGRRTVSGYVSVREGKAGKKRSAYAFVDGKWLRSDGVPDGFLVAGERPGTGAEP